MSVPALPTPADLVHCCLDAPVIGVVVTCHNQSAFIRRALRSVARQTWEHTQCVVVDDGSDDGGRVARRAVSALPAVARQRFQVVCTANQGPSRARNAGMAALHPAIRHVLFLDGDDLLMDDALTTLQKEMGDAPAIGGLCLPISDKGALLPRAAWYPRHLPDRIGADTFRKEWPLVTPGTTLWRRDAVLKVGGWPDTLKGADGEDLRGEDVLLSCKVAHECGYIKGWSVPVILKCEHEASYCNANLARLPRAWAAAQQAVAEYLGPVGGA